MVIDCISNNRMFTPAVSDEFLGDAMRLSHRPQITVNTISDEPHILSHVRWSSNLAKLLEKCTNTRTNKDLSFRRLRLTTGLQFLVKGIYSSEEGSDGSTSVQYKDFCKHHYLRRHVCREEMSPMMEVKIF